jgi:hypothetical protein
VDDAGTLAESLQDVALVPRTTTRSAPDVTMSLLVDQKVLTDSHPTSFRLGLNPPSDHALAGALVEASATPLGFCMRSPWDRLTDVSTYGPSGSEEEDDPSICWDFSGFGNPSAMRDFMTACDYCLSDCSDVSRSLDDKDYDPSYECLHVELGDPSEGNRLGMPEDGDLPRPVPRADIPRELAVVPVPAGGHDPQLEQVRGAQVGMAMGTRNPMGKNPIRARVWRILIPMGILLGHLLCPSGMVGVGMFSVAPYPLPDGQPANI